MALPADAHIGQVSLTVRDLDRSLAFYRGVLGFSELKRDGRISFLAPENGRTLISQARDGLASAFNCSS